MTTRVMIEACESMFGATYFQDVSGHESRFPRLLGLPNVKQRTTLDTVRANIVLCRAVLHDIQVPLIHKRDSGNQHIGNRPCASIPVHHRIETI